MLHCFQHSNSFPSAPCPCMNFFPSDAEPSAHHYETASCLQPLGCPSKHTTSKAFVSTRKEGMSKQSPPRPFFFFSSLFFSGKSLTDTCRGKSPSFEPCKSSPLLTELQLHIADFLVCKNKFLGFYSFDRPEA